VTDWGKVAAVLFVGATWAVGFCFAEACVQPAPPPPADAAGWTTVVVPDSFDAAVR
jgi:hypothetical protein